ncbi:hypothetical protein [Haloterrigena alkaliphila]|uniref:Uncharacterized protein n=1 Tax=Haloterrigena alkaliphila TaxID=2816475 RepID=A0A8A2VJM0_9EURY|nr:hypothetical protein [Haloterrigena alkaliphila]QSX00901.1 hypothetical protein J0X25_08060 [Haloterrigena alkaliphila]
MRRRGYLMEAAAGTIASAKAILAGCADIQDVPETNQQEENETTIDDGNQTDNGGPNDTDDTTIADRDQENSQPGESDQGDNNETETNDDDFRGTAVTIESADTVVNAGEAAEFTVRVRDTSLRASGEVELIIGRDQEVVDTAQWEKPGPGDGRDMVTLQYETEEASNTEEIPVEVQDVSTGESDNVELTILGSGENNWTDAQRELAAEMLSQYYQGYLSGISMATDSGWANHRAQIIGEGGLGEVDPWPLEEWNSVDDAFEEGMHLGSGDGATPLGEAYREKNPNRED